MAATLGDPHTLASYPISQRLKTHADHVFTNAPVGDESDFSATVGVQGDGIHIIDLTTLQDDASFIAEPSTTFAAPPVSRLERGSDSKSTRYTYAAIERAAGLEASAQGRTIWSWTSQGSLGSLEKQDSVTLTHIVSYLFAPHWMPSTVLAVSETGRATLLDPSLSVKRTQPSTFSHCRFLGSFIFPSRDTNFIAPSARPGLSSNSAILVNIFSNQSTIVISLILVGDDLNSLGNATFPHTNDVLSTSCSIDGVITLLEPSGMWRSLQLFQQGDTFALSQIDKPITLTLPSKRNSIVALSSSHAFLASIIPSHLPEIMFSLWDVQYSVLLAERRHPLPSYLSNVPLDKLRLRLTLASKSLALLVVNPSFTIAEKTAVVVKSLVLSIPYAVPESSSLKNALGKATSTQKWIKPSKGSKPAGINPAGEDILKTLKNILKPGSVEKADAAFFEWLEKQASYPENGAQVNGTGDYEEESDIDMGEEGHPKNTPKKTTRKPHINYSLTCALLATVLQPDQPKASYSPKITHYLLERKLVRDSMLDGGILKPLRDRNDWSGVDLAFQNVNDIPEAELIDTLRDCISAHFSMRRGDKPTMDVGHVHRSPNTPLSLSHMVSLLVRYPVSGPPFRVALREILSKAEEITAVLEVLSTWVQAWSEQGAMIHVEGGTNERDLMRRASKAAKSKGNEGGLPRLDLVVSFLNHLLDSSLISLLQYRPAHVLLQQLTDALEPQISFLEELDALRGPLEPFARAYIRSAKAPAERDARQKEKEAYHAAELRIGLYQVEELFL